MLFFKKKLKATTLLRALDMLEADAGSCIVRITQLVNREAERRMDKAIETQKRKDKLLAEARESSKTPDEFFKKKWDILFSDF